MSQSSLFSPIRYCVNWFFRVVVPMAISLAVK